MTKLKVAVGLIGLVVFSFFNAISDNVGKVFAEETAGSTADSQACSTTGLAGQPGCSPGSPGAADDTPSYLADLRRARKKEAGTGNSKEACIGALTALGLHYNRKEQYAKAAKALNEAYGLTDKSDFQNLEQVLPALVEAEINCHHLSSAEIHVKKLIELARASRIHQFPQLMFACNQYSRILSMTRRPAEAARYKSEADKINSNIRGL